MTDQARVATMGDPHDSPTAGEHEVTHTQGPWQVIDGHVYAADSTIAPFTAVDGTYHPDYRTGLIALVYEKDRSALLAAAPELLDALQEMLAECVCDCSEVVSKAQAAVRKARSPLVDVTVVNNGTGIRA